MLYYGCCDDKVPRSLTSEQFEDFNSIGYSGIWPVRSPLIKEKNDATQSGGGVMTGSRPRKSPWGPRIPETVPLDLEAETANGLGFA